MSDDKRKSVNWSNYGGYYSPYYDYDSDDYDYLDDWSGFSKRRKKYDSLGWWDRKDTSTKSPTTTSYSSGFGTYGGGSYRSSMSSFISGIYSGKSSLSEDATERLDKLVKKSLSLTKEFIAILDLPFKLRIVFSDESAESCSPDKRRLFIPTKIFDDYTSKEDDEIINTTVGFGLHEAAHLLYTDFELYSQAKDKEPDKHFKRFLFNLIEDERVEDLLLRNRPGYSDFINYSRNYKIEVIKSKGDTLIKKLASWTHKCSSLSNSEIDICRSIILNVIYAIRYPDLLDNEFVKNHKDFFSKVRKDLLNQPNRTLDSYGLAGKIEKEILDYLDTIFTKYYPKGSGSLLDIHRKIDESISDNPTTISYYTIDLLYGNDGDGGNSVDISGAGYISSEVIKDKRFQGHLEVFLGKAEFGSKKDTIFYKPETGDDDLFRKISAKVSKFLPQIRNKVKNVDKNSDINIYGCRTGLLDTTKLVEAIQGVPQVYYRTCKMSTNKTTVCVLVDESGSMDSKVSIDDSGIYKDVDWRGRISRAHLAREAAILLNNALGSLPGVNLYIYGHTADQKLQGNTELYIYKEPGYDNKFALTNISDKYENRDGVAILEVAKRIRNFTNDQVLMFVISDGQPSAVDYRGDSAIIDTRDKVRIASGLGFDIVQVVISCDLRERDVKSMFPNYIMLDDNIDELPTKLGQILKNSIIGNKKTVVTY